MKCKKPKKCYVFAKFAQKKIAKKAIIAIFVKQIAIFDKY